MWSIYLKSLLNRKNLMLILCLWSIVLIWLFCKFGENDFPKQPELFKKQQDYDEYCERVGEWASLGDYMYILKPASFYFLDRDLIVLSILQNPIKNDELFSKLKFTLRVSNEMNTLVYQQDLEYYSVHYNDQYLGKFIVYSILISVDLTSTLDEIKFKFKNSPLKFTLDAMNMAINKTVYRPFELTVQNFDDASTVKSGSMVCAKLLDIENEQTFNDFKTWIDLLKLQGFSKVKIHNRPIKMKSFLKEYLDQNRDFIEMYQFKCLPFLLDDRSIKYTVFKKLNRFYNDEAYVSMDTITYITINACYLKYRHNFEYVGIFDRDELILSAKQLNSLEFDSEPFEKYKHSIDQNSSTDHENYLTEQIKNFSERTNFSRQMNHYSQLHPEIKTNYPSIMFMYKWYLDNYIIDMFCSNLEITGRSKLPREGSQSEFTFSVTKEANDDAKGLVNHTISIQVSNRDEHLYAIFLCDWFKYSKNVVGNMSSKYSETVFSWFFYVYSEQIGKSIHDSRRVLTVHSHYGRISLDKNYTSFYDKYHQNDYSIGYTAHFRRVMRRIGGFYKIKDIHFDVDYFNFFSKLA